MDLCKNTFEEFKIRTENKKLIAFAPSSFLKLAAENYKDLELGKKIDYLVDNDREKQGEIFAVAGRDIPVFAPDRILEENSSEIVLLICSVAYAVEIYKQLEMMDVLRKTPCFFLPYLIAERNDNCCGNLLAEKGENKIPKIIHYFWFSKEKKDDLSEKCLQSWKTACPDYQILEWNADNYDVTKNPYMKQAFEMKKWAFVSDYARLDVIYQMGGFYFDLDVELFKNIDCLRKHEFVIGYGPYRDVEGAAFGATAGNGFVKELMNIYAERNFDWDRVMEGDIQPVYFNRIFSKTGFSMNGQYQEKDGICIYPKDIFSDRNPFTEEIRKGRFSLGVHHCAGGWWSKRDKEYHEKSMKAMKTVQKIYKEKNG